VSVHDKLKYSRSGSLSNSIKKKHDLDFGLKIKVQSNILIKNKISKAGIVNAHEALSEGYKLSLKKSKFMLFEHIDKDPLFINNFGMASKLFRYVYSDSYLPLKAFRYQPSGLKKTTHMGFYGE